MATSFWNGQKVLAAGGCGLIGSHIVEELVGAGADVTVLDNLESGSLDHCQAVSGHFRFVEGDIRDFDTCLRNTKGMDAVLNLAGRTCGVGYSHVHHGEMLYYHTVTQFNLLEAARRSGAGRYLLVSSSCVHPDEAEAPTPELPVMTGWPERVNEGYGWAKRMAELQGTYYCNEHALQVAIARPFNVYGGRYRWRGEKSQVIPTLVKRIMDGEDPLIVWGTGTQQRNFVHARDAARWMMQLTERHACAEPVNIGSAANVTIAELVALICEVAGRRPDVVFDPSKPEGKRLKSPDLSRARAILSPDQPETPLRKGIEEMILWYQQSFKNHNPLA